MRTLILLIVFLMIAGLLAAAQEGTRLVSGPDVAGPSANETMSRLDPQRPEPPDGRATASRRGLYWGDFDGDGLVDMFLARGASGCRLLRNRGDGSFDEVTRSAGLDASAAISSARWADFDQDGWLDLLAVRSRGEILLLRNLADGTFHDVTEALALDSIRGATDAVWFDYDGDGFPDLQVSRMGGDRLAHNSGSKGGPFEIVRLAEGGGHDERLGGFHVPGPDDLVAPDPALTGGGDAPSIDTPGRVRAVGAPRDRSPDLVPERDRSSLDGAGKSPLPATDSGLADCASSIQDQASGGCLYASSSPTLGLLYPMSQSMFVDGGTGNVGIGTTGPRRQLHVYAGSNTGTVLWGQDIQNSGNADTTGYGVGFRLKNSSYSGSHEPYKWVGIASRSESDWSIRTGMAFYTQNNAVARVDPTVKMVLTGAGNLGVGTTSPVQRLDLLDGAGNGALRLGNTTASGSGTIRWSGTDFEGHDGSAWKSLTSGGGGGGSLWSQNGSDIYYDAGKVTVGAGYSTASALSVIDGSGSGELLNLRNESTQAGKTVNLRFSLGTRYAEIRARKTSQNGIDYTFRTDNQGTLVDALTLQQDGTVEAPGDLLAGGGSFWVDPSGQRIAVGLHNPPQWTDLEVFGDTLLYGVLNATSGIQVEGGTSTDVLSITGGADLAEPFDIRGDEVEPGSVVSIDPDHPLELSVAREAYDTRVVGVISGAGGIRPGLTLSQDGALEGSYPVALAGRVYCRCDASFGAIREGDLLTTSPTPGHAMKVTDRSLAVGAIVGKALTRLDEGTGLVLMVVSTH